MTLRELRAAETRGGGHRGVVVDQRVCHGTRVDGMMARGRQHGVLVRWVGPSVAILAVVERKDDGVGLRVARQAG